MDPKETFSEDKSRIVRAIYFAAKYNLDISDDIINYVTNNYDDTKIYDKGKKKLRSFKNK